MTGYILISRFSGNYIDLSSLRLIRGRTLYQYPPQACKGTAAIAKSQQTNNGQLNALENSKHFALYVVGNKASNMEIYGLKELWMPNLTGKS